MSQRQRIEVKQSLRLKLSTGLLASIDMIKADAATLNRLLEEQAAENPSLALIQPAPQEWLPRWNGVLPGAGRSDLPHADAGERVAGPGPSLMAHVMAEIDQRIKAPADRRIALVLAEALAPSGWIDRPLAAMARELGCRVAEVEAVLQRLQKIEPAGLFARNLTECLTLQAQEAGLYDKVMKVVLAHLDLLARGEVGRIAQIAAVTEAEVTRRFRLIRTMDPKPGTAFDPVMAPSLREPDLVARRRSSGDWEIGLNGSALPDLRINEARGTAETRAAAKELSRLVVARNATLLRVGAEVLRRQRPALDEGTTRLQPMTMAEVAEALGLHESTVSRVVAGTSVDTPWGVWWLRKLFSRGMGATKAEAAGGAKALSAAALRDLLARRIAAEPAEAPLSDEALARGLGADLGLAIARRTVAKYRDMLGIPPAHRRKLRAR
ncbi:RNA polymerase factor sigma-54 [bacterium]|nr:RNA polymerase factor sigma-54 [bacterium]